MKEHPILFSGPMVRAILAGTKTQTRRVVKLDQDDFVLYRLTDDCQQVCCTHESHSSSDSLRTERRLHGWQRWENILTDEVQRLWAEGLRGLVSAGWAPERQGVHDDHDVSREPPCHEVGAPAGVHGFSRETGVAHDAGSTSRRGPGKQSALQSALGHPRGELAGSKSARSSPRRGGASRGEVIKRGEGASPLGPSHRVVLGAARCARAWDEPIFRFRYAPFQVGQHLWVRETWGLCSYTDPTDFFRGKYRNDGTLLDYETVYRADWGTNQGACFWRPSIHMPRWASRIALEVVSVRVERLQAISDGDARAEGCQCYVCGKPLDGRSENDCHCFHRKADVSDFRALWESINGAGSWAANPWVWCIEFKRVHP